MRRRSRQRAGATEPLVRGSSFPVAAQPAAGRTGEGDGKHMQPERSGEPRWPVWARALVSVAIVFHGVAVVAGAFGVPPSSDLERKIADLFMPYYDLFDLGYAYRFYAEPPPTPVVTATIRYGDGRGDETVRLPGRDVSGPRMRHQRQLALANALAADVQAAKEQSGDRASSPLALAFARHLCATRPGCQSVTLRLLYHLIPDIDQVRLETEQPGSGRFDLFSESLFTAPERIGEFPCDGS
jgi:hypothetical protein